MSARGAGDRGGASAAGGRTRAHLRPADYRDQTAMRARFGYGAEPLVLVSARARPSALIC